LKPNDDDPLSNFAFDCKLRRYITAGGGAVASGFTAGGDAIASGAGGARSPRVSKQLTLVDPSLAFKA